MISGVYKRFIKLFAEEEGFEPPDLLQSTVFKTAAIDHSAIPPSVAHSFFPECGCKYSNLFYVSKNYFNKYADIFATGARRVYHPCAPSYLSLTCCDT